jgi:hypothetical protein
VGITELSVEILNTPVFQDKATEEITASSSPNNKLGTLVLESPLLPVNNRYISPYDAEEFRGAYLIAVHSHFQVLCL